MRGVLARTPNPHPNPSPSPNPNPTPNLTLTLTPTPTPTATLALALTRCVYGAAADEHALYLAHGGGPVATDTILTRLTILTY